MMENYVKARVGGMMKEDVDLLVADKAWKLRSLFSVIANLNSMSEAFWLDIVKPIVTQVTIFFFNILQDAEGQAYIEALEALPHIELCYHLISYLD